MAQPKNIGAAYNKREYWKGGVMGDIADQMLDGGMCEVCGVLLNGEGYPQLCAGCKRAEQEEQDKLARRRKGA